MRRSSAAGVMLILLHRNQKLIKTEALFNLQTSEMNITSYTSITKWYQLQQTILFTFFFLHVYGQNRKHYNSLQN